MMASRLIAAVLLSLTTMVCASGVPVSVNAHWLQHRGHLIDDSQPASTSAQTSDNKITDSMHTHARVSTSEPINWRSCTLPEFSNWFDPTLVNINALQCATLSINLPAYPAALPEQLSIKTHSNESAHNSSSVSSSSAKQANSSTSIQLALSRLPASGNKIGSLLSISGGPGQSGLDVSPIDSRAYTQLSSHFDIIGFAPRGVFPSTPAVICQPGRRTLHPENPQEFAQGCWQHTPADLLAQLGADFAVDDIEAIRLALGEAQISLISYSYGTKIAALYAERFPEHLRAAVLDGVVNLNEDEVQLQVNQEAAIQRTFERFVAECQRQPGCFFAASDDLAQAEAKIANIYHYFDSHEILDLDGERITPSHLSWTLYGFMAWPDRWALLNEVLLQLQRRDMSLLRMMIEEDKSNIDFATFTAIDCADRAPNAVAKTHYLQDSQRINAQSTWDNHRPLQPHELLDACYYWPVSGTDRPHPPQLAANSPTLLLVAQTNDPATPYANALAMQHSLKAALVTRNGDGHTLALADISRCVDDTVVRYLLDPEYFNQYADMGDRGIKALTCDE